MTVPIREFTLEEVSVHNRADDCWLIISERIYDVTKFISQHPAGRSIILMHAGKDCTEAFLDVHSESYLPAFMPGAFRGILKGSKVQPLPRSLIAGRVDHDSQSVLAMRRNIYNKEHEDYRSRLRHFLLKHVVPNYSRFEMKGMVNRSVYAKMAEEGFYLRFDIPISHGGLGLNDWRYNAIVCEELEEADCGGFFVNLGNDMVLAYFTHSCTEQQRSKWMPQLVRGAVISVAMSEPEVGSDLGKLACRAERLPDGSGYVLNGRKMWISSAAQAELVVVACVTDPALGAKGISLLVIESGMEGDRKSVV